MNLTTTKKESKMYARKLQEARNVEVGDIVYGKKVVDTYREPETGEEIVIIFADGETVLIPSTELV